MTSFIIRREDETQLRAAAAEVRKHPIPWETLKRGVVPGDKSELTLADRDGVPEIQRTKAEVMLLFGWRVCITCEEQPAGILLHVSMSSPADGKVPRPESMFMLADALGYKKKDIGRFWIEEYEPGQRAVNMLIVLEERQTEGHA